MRYHLYYWPLPFRGHPIRFALAWAGADWQEYGFEEVARLKNTPVSDKPYPFLAPPVLHDTETDTWISQMPAIAMYVGRQHGLTKDPAQTLRVLCDVSDIYLEITRYHGALLWDDESWAAFRKDRLPQWIQLHEVLLQSSDTDFLFGSSDATLADLALSGLWWTMIDRLPPLKDDLEKHGPKLTASCTRIAEDEKLAALQAKWQGSTPHYCAGQIEASLLKVLNIGNAT